MINIGGYSFKTKKIETALTHSSCSEKNYERYEFLGDSILDFLIADILFKSEKYKEAELTRARANIVSEDSLSRVFDKLSVANLVKLGKSCPCVTKAIKCDIVESLVAVIYLESGLEECEKFIKNNFYLEPDERKDYKSLFQEFAQKMKYSFNYELEKTQGPAHNLTFFINLNVNGKIVASASAKSKSEAEKECARLALEIYKQ
ncbi:MAG: ribonuclease III [Clostridiales bacterium]|nr:ribonuclease III [Clostridiales bacterium]